MKIHRFALVLLALSLAACASRLTAGCVDLPPSAPIATGDAGPPPDPTPPDDSRPSPTLPLPPPSAALALLAR